MTPLVTHAIENLIQMSFIHENKWVWNSRLETKRILFSILTCSMRQRRLYVHHTELTSLVIIILLSCDLQIVINGIWRLKCIFQRSQNVEYWGVTRNSVWQSLWRPWCIVFICNSYKEYWCIISMIMSCNPLTFLLFLYLCDLYILSVCHSYISIQIYNIYPWLVSQSNWLTIDHVFLRDVITHMLYTWWRSI